MITKTLHKAKWFLHGMRVAPGATMRRLAGHFQPPLFLFQMGKVGSMTIRNTLERHYYVCHVHAGDLYDGLVRQHHREGRMIEIITATRDPVGREISAFFQNLTAAGHPYGVGSREEVLEMGVDGLIEVFHERWRQGVPDTTVWFDQQFKPHVGVDVYQHPFDPEKGWTLIEENGRRILIVRFEDIRRNYLDAVNAFVEPRFGTPARFSSLLARNVSEQKWYADLMRGFKKKIRFSKDRLDDQYGGRYCTHFYSTGEISDMRGRWKTDDEEW